MNVSNLEKIINDAWENRDKIDTNTKSEESEEVEKALNRWDNGQLRVAEHNGNNAGKVSKWIKK